MAAKKSEDSKQGLIIALVFMFLLCVGLGVGTYLGFNGQKELETKAKEADKKYSLMEKTRNWEKFQKLWLQNYVGQPLTETDQTALSAGLSDFESGQLGKDQEDRTAFEATVKAVQTELGWDAANKKPTATFFGRFNQLRQNSDASDKRATLAEANLQKAKKDFDDGLKAANDQADKWKKDLDDSKKSLAQTVADKSAQFQRNEAMIAKLSGELDDIKRKIKDTEDDTKKAADKLAGEIRDLKTQNDRLRDQIKPKNVLDYDKPKGKIISVERSGGVAYINLGSNDNVKPGLTFSIYAAGANGLAEAHRKGSLEVTKVLGANNSQARLTDTADQGRDPILRGDLLFNPVWSPTLKEHIAIAGLIDLTGDGRDNTQEFIRNLRDQGIVVDAYLDLNDLRVKGDGMTLRTQFLVLGDQPEFGADFQSGDTRNEHKQDLLGEMAKMQTQATKMGVMIVPYRRFLTVIGYPMPRVLASKSSSFLESLQLGAGKKAKESDKAKDKAPADKEK